MSVNGSNADLTNIGNLSCDYIQRGTTTVATVFEKSYYNQYTYTGGTTTFDIAEIQIATDTGARGAGMVEVTVCGAIPPSGSSISLRGSRKVIIGFHYESGSFSSTTLLDNTYDSNGSVNVPTISLVYTGGTTSKATCAVRSAFTDSASTLVWRQATHVKLYSGGLAGPGQTWALT